MHLATVYPDRISVRYEKDYTTTFQRWNAKFDRANQPRNANLEIKKKTFALSYQSKRKIIDSSNLLIKLSKPRTVQLSSKKSIFNYRASFVTLTLPSAQVHTDIEIKSCLNNFLTTLRTTYGLKNYIWKAELQKNENIHFHLIIDHFIHYAAIRYYWNKALNVLGYVDRYQDQFQDLSFHEYATLRKRDKKDVLNAWLHGVQTKWTSPPTENVKSVYSMGQIGYYVSKYITKQVKDQETNEDDEERILSFGRTWARSQSLSAIKVLTRYDWLSMKAYIKSITNDFEGLKMVVHEYCTVYYFDYKKLTGDFRKWLKSKIFGLGITFQYPFPHLATG